MEQEQVSSDEDILSEWDKEQAEMEAATEVIASSNDDVCIDDLHYDLERKYSTIKFHCRNSYTSQIKVNPSLIDKTQLVSIRTYCAGFIDGYERGNR